MRLVALAALFCLWATYAHAQDPLHRALEPYALYQTDITAMLGANIPDSASMDAALDRTARHDPERLTQGWLAYGALTAAQSPAWVNGVRARVRAAGRPAVLRQLRRDWTYARRRPPGADEAVQLVLRAFAADNARLNAGAVRFEALGHAGDTSTWARRSSEREATLRAPNTRALAPELLARLRPAPLAAAPMTEPIAFGGTRFWDALGNRASPAPPILPWRVVPARQPSLDRMLTLAALFVVEATPSETARLTAALTDEPVRQCLAMQQLELRQCASVTSTPNEDAFCIARHGFAGPGACMNLSEAP
ncbi:MAG: hypothetical protein NT015_08960 [Alphaproteobacteria bacterium]|nr:hypothetical protein [Alphaproteobacteria bacterium]